MSQTGDVKLPLRVPKEQIEFVRRVGTYGENVYYLIFSKKSMWFGPFVPTLKFVSAFDDLLYSTTNLPETRYILGVVTNPQAGTFVYCYRADEYLNINIYATNADYSTVLTHTFSTQMTCGGSGLSTSFASPSVDKYVLFWGNISNDSFFHVFMVQKHSEAPFHTSTSLQRVENREVHACVRFRLIDVMYPGADETVYHCQARGMGRDAPDRLSVILYHAGLVGTEKAKVVFSSIVQLPFDMYYEDGKETANGEDEYFGCEAVVQSVQIAKNGTSVCLLYVDVSQYVPSEPDISPTVSSVSAEKDRCYVASSVFLLLSLHSNTLLDMYIPDEYLSPCTIDCTGQYIVRVVASD